VCVWGLLCIWSKLCGKQRHVQWCWYCLKVKDKGCENTALKWCTRASIDSMFHQKLSRKIKLRLCKNTCCPVHHMLSKGSTGCKFPRFRSDYPWLSINYPFGNVPLHCFLESVRQDIAEWQQHHHAAWLASAASLCSLFLVLKVLKINPQRKLKQTSILVKAHEIWTA